MEKERFCQECKEPINGRSDKKFCSDICRNSFNNRLNSDANNYVRNINNVLRKNRRILSEIAPEGKASIQFDKLIEKGYSPGYTTHTYVNRKGDTYYFCYEYGYIRHGNDFCTVVKSKYAESGKNNDVVSESRELLASYN